MERWSLVCVRDVKYHKTGSINKYVLKGIKKNRRVDELRKVGADTLLAVLVCFLLGFFEDELRYVAVEVVVCDRTRH